MTACCPIAYHNGAFVPLGEACISPLDRGFLFADSVYEVIPVYDGHLFRLSQHLDRLAASLAAIRLSIDTEPLHWDRMLGELVERNGGGQLSVYLQVTRGAPAIRDHGFPPMPVEPTIFAMASPLKPLPEAIYRQGIAAVTGDDLRWGRCDIKSTALLANVLSRQGAIDAHANDMILVRNGYLTEATAANVFLVDDGVLLTPPKSWRILPGITRDLVLELAAAHGIPFRESELPFAKLESASEAWLTSSTREIVPVTTLNGRPIGDGRPGPIWRRMHALFDGYKNRARPTADPQG